MRISRFKKSVIMAVPGLLLVFLLSGADVYLWQAGLLPARPALVKAGVLLPIFALLFAIQLLKDEGGQLVSLYTANAPLLAAIFFLASVQTLWSLHPGAYWDDGGYLALRQLTLFMLVLLIMPVVLIPGFVESYRNIVLAALGIFLVTMLTDLFNPGTYSSTGVGVAGWAENPNYAAGAVIALAILAADWSRYRKSDWAIWGLVGSLVIFTGSRSGFIMWLISAILWNRQHFSGLHRLIYLFLAFTLFAVAMTITIHYSVGDIYIGKYLVTKLKSFTDWDMLTQGERLSLVSHYLDLVGQHPVFGHGAWFWMRGETGAHNVYLMLWASNGITGLISYLLLILLAFYNSYRLSDKRTFVLVLVIFLIQGFFSHMLIVRDLFFVVLALASGLAWVKQSEKNIIVPRL